MSVIIIIAININIIICFLFIIIYLILDKLSNIKNVINSNLIILFILA
jgi:hypothetical protein